MSSHLQLLGLGIVDQLATLETSLISTFLESSLRLANLINADFFILVQSPTGVRKVAGSDTLCREYAAGSLSPGESDVRSVLRNSEVPINEEPLISGGNPADALLNDCAFNLNFDNFSNHHDSSTPKSVIHHRRVLENFHPARDQVNPFSSPPLAVSRSLDHEANARPRVNGTHAGSKRPIESVTHGGAAKKTKPNCETTSDAGSSPPKTIPTGAKFECFDDDDVEIVPFDVPEYVDSDSLSIDHRRAMPMDENEDLSSFGFPENGIDIQEADYDLQPVRDYMTGNPKVKCIVGKIAAADLDLTRQSSDIRLFGSIMYDLGKMISKLVRNLDKSHPETKSHFAQAFVIICDGLPGLESISQEATGFKDSFRGLTLRAHLRCQLYSAFKNSLNRLIKNASMTQSLF